MNVTVAEVLAGAEARAVPLSAECVGYLVLAAADQVSAAPRRIDPNDVLLFEDGGIRVASGRAADGSLAERDLRAVLDALLVRASAPTTGLLRASRRPPGAGIEAFVRELETALIPVNRSAAKRSLARLERETVRALQSGRISVPPPSAQPAEAERAVVGSALPAASLSGAPLPAVAPAVPVGVASVAPAAPFAEIPELSVAPPAATVHEKSTVPPPIASVAPRRGEPHEPVAVAVSTLAPPPLEHTAALPVASAEQGMTGETVVMAPVSPKSESDPQLVETRPEPVVRRASLRPPAPPAELIPSTATLVRTEPLTFVRSCTGVGAEPLVKTPPSAAVATADTPVVPPPLVAPPPFAAPSPPFVASSPSAAPPFAASSPSAPAPFAASSPSAAPPFAASSPSAAPPLVASSPPAPFAASSPSAAPPLVASSPSAAAPFVAALPIVAVESERPQVTPVFGTRVQSESALPPVVHVRGEEFELDAALELALEEDVDAAFEDDGDVDVLEVIFDANEPALEPSADALVDASESTEPCPPLAAESLPPAPVIAEAVPEVFTPPPRTALPTPRRSDVEDLLRRLEAAPLTEEELRAGLRSLAGIEPTPPPPGLGDES